MYKDYITYQVETIDGMEWIARFPQHNNVGGSGKTEQEAIDDAIKSLRFEMSLNLSDDER